MAQPQGGLQRGAEKGARISKWVPNAATARDSGPALSQSMAGVWMDLDAGVAESQFTDPGQIQFINLPPICLLINA
jgi:hypothetical protein